MKIFNNNNFLAIDIGSYSIKFAEIKINKEKQIILENFGYTIIPPEIIINGYIISLKIVVDYIKKLKKYYKIKAKKCGISLPGNKVIIKRFSVPQENLENLDELIKIEAEQYIPYDLNDVSLDYDVIEKENETNEIEILLVGSKKEIIEDYLTILAENELMPYIADVDFFTLQNSFEYNYKGEISENSIYGILNIGNQITNIIFLKGFEGLFYREANIGSFEITKNISKKLKISYNEAEKIKLTNFNLKEVKEATENFFKDLHKEITKSIELFKNNFNIDNIDKLYLSGGGSMIKGMKQFFEISINSTKFEYFHPFKNFLLNKKIDKKYLEYIRPIFSICSGLSLRGLEID